MGAEFNSISLKGDWKTVKAKFEALQDEDRHANGHEYSGGLGMARGLQSSHQRFKTDDEADQWLQDNTSKWEAAVAVTVDEPKMHWRIGAWCSC